MQLRRKISLTLFLLGFFLHGAYAQTASISGIVNHYASVKAIQQVEINNNDSLVVSGMPDAFNDGDTVMLYVVRGADIRLVDSGVGDIGDIANPRFAGKYAFLIITEIIYGPVDTIVVLNAGLYPEIKPLAPDEVAQLIRVPSYKRAIVNGEVFAPPWNGSTGGVVTMFVSTTLTLNADINVSGLGFRGANWAGADGLYEGACSNTNEELYDSLFYQMNPILAGQKGEAISSILFESLRGKGRNINGGGGGNGRLSGGGGGGNYSPGGKGGDESEECISILPDQGGEGGVGLGGSYYYNKVEAPSTVENRWNRIFFGGGGGAGVNVSGYSSSAGGNGGGAVVIVADTIDGNDTGFIRADGATVQDIVNGAGGGGGGGGAIVLDVSSFINRPNLSAVGGKGGDTNGNNKTGPGGGGGGGIYWLAGSPLLDLDVELAQGQKGIHRPSSDDYGANEGTIPSPKGGLEAPLRGFLFNTVPTEFKVCSDQVPEPIMASYPKGGSGDYSFQWVDSSATQDIWTPISGATGPDLTFSVPLDDTTYFRRIVTDPLVTEPDISFRIAVYVHQAIDSNIIASPDTVCQGNIPEAFVSVGLPIYGDNMNYDYLWQKIEENGSYVPADGNNDSSWYAPPALNVSTNFRRIVSSGGVCVDTSDELRVEVFAPISGNLIADYDTICFNTSPDLITQDPEIGLGGGDPDLTNWRYRWESGPAVSGPWEEVPAETSPEFQPGNLTATTWYRREVLSGNDDACRDTSPPVEILNVPVITGNEITSDDQTVCTDDQPELMQGSGPGGGLQEQTYYLWESFTESTGIWSAADNTNGNNLQSYTPPVMTGDTTIYRRVVASGGQEGVCKDTSVSKTINVLPAIDNNAISTAVMTNCQFDLLASLNGTIPIGGATEDGVDPTRNYRWEQATGTDAPGNFAPISYGPVEVNYEDQPELSLADDYWYRRVVLSGPSLGGQSQVCSSISDTIHIVIHTAISNNLVDAADSACFNTEKVLNGALPAGEAGEALNYSWWDIASGIELGTEKDLPYTFTGLEAREFRRAVVIGVCEDSSNIMDITVMELPGGILSGNLPAACEELVQLDVELNVGNITNYNTDWVISFFNGVDPELVDTSELDANSTQHKVDVALSTDEVSTQYNYTIGKILYELSDGTECVAPPENLSGNVPIEVFYTPKPSISINTPLEDSSICGDLVELTVTPDKGTGSWNNDNSAKLRFTPDGQALSVSASVDTSDPDAWDQLPYLIYFTSTAGVCSGFDTVGIYFYDQPDDAFAGGEFDTAYFNTSVPLNADHPTAGLGTWTAPNNPTIWLDDENNPKSMAHGLTKDANNEFTWTIVNGVCETSDDRTVIFMDRAQPYEGFSPNGDQRNDYFIIRGLAEADEWSISIFNSLGNSVRTINQDNVGEIEYDPMAIPGGLRRDEKVVWDGKSNNGNMVPAGTYYYVLNAKKEQVDNTVTDQKNDKRYIVVRY